MLFKNRMLVFAAMACAVAGSDPAAADEPGFWGRLNPFRTQVSRSSETPDQIESGPTQEQLAELRQRLAERGLSAEQVDARISHILEARQSGEHMTGPPAFAGQGRPTLEELRAHLISRGVDPAMIDARIEHIATAGAHGQAIAEMNRNRRSGDEMIEDPATMPAVVENEIAEGAISDPGDDVAPALDFAASLAATETPFEDLMPVEGELPAETAFDLSATEMTALETTDFEATAFETTEFETTEFVPETLSITAPANLPTQTLEHFPQPLPPATSPITGAPFETLPSFGDEPVPPVAATDVVDAALSSAAETVNERAPAEAPASTVVSPSFRQEAAGLRGGFGRGRTRGE